MEQVIRFCRNMIETISFSKKIFQETFNAIIMENHILYIEDKINHSTVVISLWPTGTMNGKLSL